MFAVTFGAAPITGAVVSRTVIEKLVEPTFPAASLAAQETTVAPSGNTEPLTGEHDTLVTPAASLAVGNGKLTAAPAALVASATRSAGLIRTGAVTSLTITLKVAVAVLPAASAAVHVTGVDPSGNDDPLAGEQVNDVTPTLSVAVGEYVAVALVVLAGAFTVISGVAAKTGAVASLTMTVNVVVEVLPAASDAVHVTTVEPIGNVEPLAGEHTIDTTPVSSVAEGVNDTTAVVPLATALTVRSGVAANTGGVTSLGTSLVQNCVGSDVLHTGGATSGSFS